MRLQQVLLISGLFFLFIAPSLYYPFDFPTCWSDAKAAPSEYDYRQDDKFDHYREADSDLAYQTVDRLSAVETKLKVAIGAAGALILGLLVPWVRKKVFKIGLILIFLSIGLTGCGLKSHECVKTAQGWRCEQLRCRTHRDCAYQSRGACGFCDQYYFVCH